MVRNDNQIKGKGEDGEILTDDQLKQTSNDPTIRITAFQSIQAKMIDSFKGLMTDLIRSKENDTKYLERNQMEDLQHQKEIHREEHRKLENARREAEDVRERPWEALLHECTETSSSMTRMTGSHNRGYVPPFCQQLCTDYNLVSLLSPFKTHMSSFSVPKEQWPAYLLPVLSSEAKEAYSLFDNKWRLHFDILEKGLLNHFHIGPEIYELKVMKLEKRTDEPWISYWRRLRVWSK